MELKNIYAYAEALVSDVKSSIAKGGKNSDGDIRAESGGSLGKTAVLSAELVMPDMTGAYSGASGTDDVDNDADDGMRPGDSFPGEDSFPDHETAPDGPDGYEGSDDAAATDGEMFCSNTMRKIFYSNMRWKLASCQQAAGAAMTRRKVRRPAWKERGIMA